MTYIRRSILFSRDQRLDTSRLTFLVQKLCTSTTGAMKADPKVKSCIADDEITAME